MSDDTELSEMQQRFALLKADRDAYESIALAAIKQNEAEIVRLRAHLADVQARILDQRRTSGTRDDAAAAAARRATKLETDVMLLQRRIDRAACRTRDAERRIASLNDEIDLGSRELQAVSTSATPEQHRVVALENEVASAQVRAEEAATVRAFLERVERGLREESVHHVAQLEQLSAAVAAAAADLAELQRINADAGASSDEARAILEARRAETTLARSAWAEELDRLQAETRAAVGRASTATTARNHGGVQDQGAASSNPVDEQSLPQDAPTTDSAEVAAAAALLEAAGATDVEEAVAKFRGQDVAAKQLTRMTEVARARVQRALDTERELTAASSVSASAAAPVATPAVDAAEEAQAQALRAEAAVLRELGDVRAAMAHLTAVSKRIMGQNDDLNDPNVIVERLLQLRRAVEAAEEMADDSSDDMCGGSDPLADDSLWASAAVQPSAEQAPKNRAERLATGEPRSVLNAATIKTCSALIMRIEGAAHNATKQ